VPLAARVNQEGIPLADFEAELKRLQDALKTQGKELPLAEQRKFVMDELVAQVLFAQAAVQAGYKLDDAALEARLQNLAKEAGGEAALKDWMARNGYTDASFRSALRKAAEATWQRDQVAAAVSEKTEQVHARQILVSESATADSILSQLRAGANFGTLASRYDPLTGGEMGWFPRGYLPYPAIEAAAFNLKPGEYSPIIQLNIGYLIIQVTERNPQRPLSPDARRALQTAALQTWLKERKSQSKIEILVP
jgi:parvulin-like peptidyl-prolyl isomerase